MLWIFSVLNSAMRKSKLLWLIFALGMFAPANIAQAQDQPQHNLSPPGERVRYVTIARPDPGSATLRVRLLDGQRKLVPPPTPIYYRLIDSRGKTVFQGVIRTSSVVFQNVPVAADGQGGYQIIISRDGYDQVKLARIHLRPGCTLNLDLMEIPQRAVFDFSHAHAKDLQINHPDLWRIIANGSTSEDAAVRRWEDLIVRHPNRAASVLNIMTAMEQMRLPNGNPMLPYCQELIWDRRLAQDRFFAWVDADLEQEVELGVAAGEFASQPAAKILHPGATEAFKQIALDEANLNPTFHGRARRVANGIDCVLLEVDIDYYKNPLSHAFAEVIPNMVTGALTDPMKVYMLRFNAGAISGLPQYDPPETIIAVPHGRHGRHSDGRSWRNWRLLRFWEFFARGTR